MRCSSRRRCSVVVSAKTYEEVALEDDDGHWELDHGCLRQKPGMSFDHNGIMRALARRIDRQLDEREYEVAMDSSKTRIESGTFYIPDLVVIPTALARRGRQE